MRARWTHVRHPSYAILSSSLLIVFWSNFQCHLHFCLLLFTPNIFSLADWWQYFSVFLISKIFPSRTVSLTLLSPSINYVSFIALKTVQAFQNISLLIVYLLVAALQWIDPSKKNVCRSSFRFRYLLEF